MTSTPSQSTPPQCSSPSPAPTVPSIRSPHSNALTTARVFLGSPQLSIQQPESHRAACDLQGPAGPDPSASPASPPTTAPASSPHTCLPACFRPWKHARPSLPWAPNPLTHTPPSGFSLKSTSFGKPDTGSKKDQVPCSRLSLHWCFSCGCLPPYIRGSRVKFTEPAHLYRQTWCGKSSLHEWMN